MVDRKKEKTLWSVYRPVTFLIILDITDFETVSGLTDTLQKYVRGVCERQGIWNNKFKLWKPLLLLFNNWNKYSITFEKEVSQILDL